MKKTAKPIGESLKEYARGIAGGLLFSLPMLYTMELWWAGFMAGPAKLLLYVVVGLFLLMIYNHYVGIRQEHSYWDNFCESVEELGMGLILTVFLLWLTGRILPGMSLSEISGKIVVEAVTFAIGISVGKTQLGSGGDDEDKDSKPSKKRPSLIREINIGLCGAVLIAANVAPTEEIVVIALESATYKLFIMALISMAIGGAILYYTDFKGSVQLKISAKKPMQAIVGTVIMYCVALVSSAFMLWYFGRFNGLGINYIVAETVVLGFPAALGASAGRLLIQV